MTKAQLVRPPETSTSLVPYGDRRHEVWNGRGAGHERQENAIKFRALLRRHLRPIVAIMGLCLMAALLVTLLMTPSYKVKTVIELLAENQDFMNNKDIDPNVSASSMESYLDTQTRLLSSDELHQRVVSSMLANSSAYPNYKESPMTKLKVALGLEKAGAPALEADIRKELAAVKVKPEGQSRLIGITVVGPSAQLAADTANTIATQHISGLQNARTAMAEQTTDFLSIQLNAFRNKLKQSENDLESYARKTGLIYTSGSDKDSVGAEKLREVQSDLEKSEADRADKQSQMELIDSTSPDTLPRVLDDGSVREAKSRLAELRRQLADLNSLYTPNHYKVMEVQSQISALEEQVKQERGAVVARVKNDYRAAVRREALQRQEYSHQLAVVTDQSSKQIGYNILKREADANRDLYQSMLQKVKEASVLAALHASNIRIVDRARPPLSPDQPNGPLNTGIAILAGLMLSVLYVLLRERTDSSIRSVGETMRVLQLPELAVVPRARLDIRAQIVGASNNGTQRIAGLVGKRVSSSTSDLSRDLVTNWRTTGSVVAESYRSAVASIILWGRKAELLHKVLVITSAHSDAGKTTSVLNLGLGLVESGRCVLLIDGDMRLPRLGQIFGIDNALGLSDILAGDVDPALAKELIVESGLPGLKILPSGRRFSNVTELLHLSQLRHLLDDLRPDYDFILVDSPPALPLTDARLLAQHSDGVILLVRAGSTTMEQTLTVQQCMNQDGTHIVGTILNHWDAKSEDPAYMTSYLKYAVAPRNDKRMPGSMAPKRRSAGVGD